MISTGMPLYPPGDVVPAVLIEHVSLDAAGSEGVAGDALAAAVDGKCARKALDGGLGARVQRVIGDTAHLGSDGRGEDNATPPRCSA